jgi:glycosyltransferase involved in cell wall biosynthesis
MREGVGRHVLDVALGLSKRGHEVHVVYSPIRVDRELLGVLAETQGIFLTEIAMRREPHWTDLRALTALWRYISLHGPFDIIHAHSSKAGVLARLVGVIGMAGVIYTPHAFATLNGIQDSRAGSSSEFSPQMLFVYGLVERMLAGLTDRIICSADAEFSHAREWLGIPEHRLVTMLNSVDPATFRFDSDLRRELGLAADALIIGFVGRLSPQKGADIAIRSLASVLAHHPDAVLAVVGAGEQFDSLKELAESCHVDHAVHWLGKRPAREYFHNFNVLICPSRYDAGAYTPLEGLFCGLPVICTPVGMVPEMVSHGINGFIVPPEDPDALAAQTIAVLGDPELRRSVGSMARRFSDYLLLDRMLDELEEIYFGRLSGRRPLTAAARQAREEVVDGALAL